jgi:hypothetical protein
MDVSNPIIEHRCLHGASHHESHVPFRPDRSDRPLESLQGTRQNHVSALRIEGLLSSEDTRYRHYESVGPRMRAPSVDDRGRETNTLHVATAARADSGHRHTVSGYLGLWKTWRKDLGCV